MKQIVAAATVVLAAGPVAGAVSVAAEEVCVLTVTGMS